MKWPFYLLSGVFFMSFYTVEPTEATTRTQDAVMAACLQHSHARDVVRYCVARRGTKRQQRCVVRAQGPQALRKCVVGTR